VTEIHLRARTDCSKDCDRGARDRHLEWYSKVFRICMTLDCGRGDDENGCRG
jgi:hypothetical protein